MPNSIYSWAKQSVRAFALKRRIRHRKIPTGLHAIRVIAYSELLDEQLAYVAYLSSASKYSCFADSHYSLEGPGVVS